MTYHTATQFQPNSSHRNATVPVKPLMNYNNHQQQYSNIKNTQYPHGNNGSSSGYEEIQLCRVMCGWIAEDVEVLSMANAQHYLRLIRDIMVLINPHALRDNLLVSTVFYADRFVKRRGVKLEESRKAFLVLLISALVTIKMWEDFEVKTESLERFTGISRKQIAVLERQFLGVLEYSLFYSHEEMLSWQIQCCFPQPPSA